MSGVRDDKMVAKLLTKKMEELTFDKAVTICVGLEHTTRDTAKVVGRAKQPDDAERQVNRVSDANVCPRCLLPHKEEECILFPVQGDGTLETSLPQSEKGKRREAYHQG